MNESGLRPRGTVEVRCAHPNCGVAWWVDPLDPRFKDPNHIWDCGDDHRSTSTVQRRLSVLKLQTGYHWGTIQPRGQESKSSSCPGCRSSSSGYAIIHDRERVKSGALSWEHPDDLKDPIEVASRIEWDFNNWPESLKNTIGSPSQEPPCDPAFVPWVGYQIEGSTGVRRYTFVKCSRPGCHQKLMVDYDDPNFKPEGYSVGVWGGGDLEKPSWWDHRTFRCEDGMSTQGPQPCALVRSEALSEFEQTSRTHWTIWWSVGNVGSVLFYDDINNKYGLLTFKDTTPFESFDTLKRNVDWGTIASLAKNLRLLRSYGTLHDEVLTELEKHVNLPS